MSRPRARRRGHARAGARCAQKPDRHNRSSRRSSLAAAWPRTPSGCRRRRNKPSPHFSPAQARPPDPIRQLVCVQPARRFPIPHRCPAWNGWGADTDNSRYQGGEAGGLTAADVPNLKLKWAFGFPGGTVGLRVNPSIVAGGRVFVGSDNGTVYALDAGSRLHLLVVQGGRRGAQRAERNGSRSTANRVSSSISATSRRTSSRSMPLRPASRSGRSRSTRTRSRASPARRRWLDGKLVRAGRRRSNKFRRAQPTYECCTFRGSVVALDAATGTQTEEVHRSGSAAAAREELTGGRRCGGPAGAAVWSAADDRHAQGLSSASVPATPASTSPAVKTSDAVIAMDLTETKILGRNQATSADAFVIGCRPGNENCPKEVGPDFDFGNAPILRTLPGGKRDLVIGQKSGIVWGLDPDNEGQGAWQFRAGKGGALGGVEWGLAADEQAAYIPVSDVWRRPNEAGGLFALKLATGEKILEHAGAERVEPPVPTAGPGAQSAPASVIPGVVFSGIDRRPHAGVFDGRRQHHLGLQHSAARVRDGQPRAGSRAARSTPPARSSPTACCSPIRVTRCGAGCRATCCWRSVCRRRRTS